MTVYVDLLFSLNTIINYLLLRGSAAVGGCPAGFRLVAASVIGGVYAVLSVCPGLSFLQGLFWQGICAAIMVVTAFGLGKNTAKQGLLFLALSFAFSGAVMILVQTVEPDCVFLGGRAYYAVSMPAMLLLAGCCYLIAALVLKNCGAHTGGDISPVTLQEKGHSLSVRALRDTGNTLRDPVSGQNVLVVDGRVLSTLFPGSGITEQELEDPAALLEQLAWRCPDSRFRLLSYRAVGVSSGLLLAVRCKGRIGKKTQSVLAAFSPVPLGDTFEAVWGGEPS